MIFWADWERRWFRLIPSWFGALALCAAFYESFDVKSERRPPVVSFDSLPGSFLSWVSRCIAVMVQRNHPPSKVVVFRNNDAGPKSPETISLCEGKEGEEFA